MAGQKQVVKAAGLIGIITVISRLLGVVRDAIIAQRLGANYLSDSFNIAFEIPNLVRRVLGEGALSAFIVPVYSRKRHEDGADAAWRFVSNALNALFIVTFILTILGMLGAKYLFIAFGGIKYVAYHETEYLRLGATLTRIMFPFLMFLGLSSLIMGVLHSHRHFTTPALGSVMLNLTIIASSFLFLSTGPSGFVFILAWAVIAGVIIRLLIMLPPLISKGFHYFFYLNPKSAELQQLFKMMVQALFGILVVHINISISLNFANWLGPGCVTYIRNSNRLVQFPLAIFAGALATALLPTLSKNLIENKIQELRKIMVFAFKIIIVLFFPAMVGLIILGLPIIELILQRGLWTPEATAETYFALIFYALGLLPLAGLRILIPLYYARQDVLTPVKIGSLTIACNVILNFLFLFTPLRQGGLALAYTMAMTLNFFLLLIIMARKFGPLLDKTVGDTLVRAAIASITMGIIIHYLFSFVITQIAEPAFIVKALLTLTCIIVGIVIYLVLANLLRIAVIGEAVNIILRRKIEAPDET